MVRLPEWPAPPPPTRTVKNRVLARLVDANGVMLEPPNPAFQLIEDGMPICMPICNFTLEQVIDIALKQLSRDRDPQSERAVGL